ncbi:MAG: lamin tail domain-containing protein, partial [Elusimicrobia bacterium]|nr:lamin tail domain-containing protein [Elusimicrobiota bacterium]
MNPISATVLINEFVYDPAGADTGNEWIELYNSGSSTESVTDWRIEVDENRFPGRVCARLCGSIPPFGYYLIKESVTAISTSVVADLISGTMAMGNAGSKSDGVQLVDDMGTVRDRILYGKPDSDSLCGGICSTAPTASNGAGLSRSTPGSPQWVSVPVSSVTPRSGGGIPCILFVSSQNGISEQDRGGDLLEVAQSPFSPLGDGIYREARILYRVPSNTDGVLEIYDVLGNNVLRQTSHRGKKFVRLIPILSCGLTVFFLRATLVMASFEYKPAGARSQSLSGTCSAPSGDATAPFWNPAALSFLSQGEWVSFYTQLFSLKELRYGGTAIAVPTKMGAFGSAYSQFGFSQYMERQMILSHSLSLSEGVWMGYSLKGLFLQIEGFGSSSAFGLDIGLNTTLSEKLRLGLFARNLNRPTIGEGGETISRSFSI